MNLNPDSIREIRALFTEEFMDINEPDLKDLAEARDIPYKVIKQIAERENWEGIRHRNKSIYARELAKSQEEMLSKKAIDVVKTTEISVKRTLEFLSTQVPLVQSMLKERLPEMTTKELLTYLRLLSSMEKDVVSLIHKAYNEATADSNESMQLHEFLNDIRETTEALSKLSDGEFDAEHAEEVSVQLSKFD